MDRKNQVVSRVSRSHVQALLQSIRRKRPNASPIGIWVPELWADDQRDRMEVDGLEVMCCDSVLGIREQLLDCANRDLALVTPLSEHDLGLDVTSRLWRGRLFRVHNWRIVCDLMQVDAVDARLSNETWMADALLEAFSRQTATRLPGRVLDRDTAWHVLCRAFLGWETVRPDAVTLCRWARDPEEVARFADTPPDFQEHLSNWLETSAGSVAKPMIAALRHGFGGDLLPLGLLNDVLFGEGTPVQEELARAVVRIEERFLGGSHLSVQAGLAWAAAAKTAMGDSFEHQQQQWIRKAQEILEELELAEFAYHSDMLVSSFEQRLESFSDSLCESLDQPKATVKPVAAAYGFLENHKMSGIQDVRMRRARMALRGLAYLKQKPIARNRFDDVLADFCDAGGHVDWVRRYLALGESNPRVSQGYGRLLAALDDRRESQNQAFGSVLADAQEVLKTNSQRILLEDVLDEIVGPVATHLPVLLLVLDGMSLGDCREILNELHARGFSQLVPNHAERARPGISPFPTVTQVARTSLFCGTLKPGSAADEKQGFASHSALLAACRGGSKPELFHKGQLTEPGRRSLNAELYEKLTDSKSRVIGIVLNAIDDHLNKSDQLESRWDLNSIPLLQQILEAAQVGNRAVILASDHGHVLDRGTTLTSIPDAGERYRAPTDDVHSFEMMLTGPRVIAPQNRIVVPWSERVRYKAKKNGYHGGISPQEVVVPLVVVKTTAKMELPDWREARFPEPDWWAMESAPDLTEVPVKPKKRKKTIAQPLQPSLFEPTEMPDVATAAEHWVERLFASGIFQEQKSTMGRTCPSEDKIRRCLLALDDRGGSMTLAALEKAMDLPSLRMTGFLSAMRRLLTLDGYPALETQMQTRIVTLNLDKLKTQFGLT